MTLEQFCIVPKKIMEDFANRSLVNNENPEVNENSILLDKKQKPFSEKKLPDLSIEISNLFPSAVKVKKAKEIYSWGFLQLSLVARYRRDAGFQL